MQVLLLGPPLAPIWLAGVVALLRRPSLRPVRALAVAYPVICLLLLAIGGQPYYTAGLLLAFYAVGCVPTVRWLVGRPWRRALVVAGVAVNAAVSAVVALPVVPVGALGDTPIPDLNQVARDQVGWPAYVRQVAGVVDSLDPAERERAIILAANYGEAGALLRYADEFDLPPVYSGHNELHRLGPPPESTDVVVAVGVAGDRFAEPAFAECTVAARLDNGVDVDNEEQGVPVRVCRGRTGTWAALWPRFRHLD